MACALCLLDTLDTVRTSGLDFCEPCRNGPVFLELAKHAPDHEHALAYVEFAEANAVRDRKDPTPYVAFREQLAVAS